MATDYNANLIVELYSTQDPEQATRISDEMVSIGDAVFPRQIYEAYKRFKNTTVSHYFVSDLTSFKTADAGEILKEIAQTTQKESDISMMINYLTDIEYFDPLIVAKLRGLFESEIDSGDTYDSDVEKYFNYLQKAGEDLKYLEELMQIYFEDERQDISSRKIALKKLLKLKPTDYIKIYYDNYERMKGKRMEIIFVEEISTWHGGIIPDVHKKILNIGSERAKEILKKEQLKKADEKKTQEINEQKEVKAEYETADVIASVAELRTKINKISSTDERFNFPLLTASEEIYQQSKPAKDKTMLIGYCMTLRPLLGGFSDKVLSFEISEERALELIPDLQNFNGSINKFQLLLLEKKINVDSGIFGLRNLNRIITKFAAHTNEESSAELHDILKEENLFDYYKEDNWSKLHRQILIKYEEFLEKLVNALNGK